jgi:hypothetical protein
VDQYLLYKCGKYLIEGNGVSVEYSPRDIDKIAKDWTLWSV